MCSPRSWGFALVLGDTWDHPYGIVGRHKCQADLRVYCPTIEALGER